MMQVREFYFLLSKIQRPLCDFILDMESAKRSDRKGNGTNWLAKSRGYLRAPEVRDPISEFGFPSGYQSRTPIMPSALD